MILINNIMKIEQDIKLDFQDVLIRPKRSTLSSRSQVNLERTFSFPHSTMTWTGVPIIAANMDTIGTFEVCREMSKHKMLTALHKFYTPDDFKNSNLDTEYVMVSTGINEKDFIRLKEIMKVVNFKWICIDVANGYMDALINFCQRVRKEFPDKIIVAGNVVTREMTEDLIKYGQVDVVKIGIGPGSMCITRLKTGVGMPQLSAIIECADAAHGLNGHIISDGGCTCPGDFGKAKAFGAGADFTMAGGLFSGHDENPGELIIENGKQYKLFYGMSSEHAMTKHYGKMAKYRSSEGRCIKVNYKGPIEKTILDYLGGLRSACAYINSNCIKNMSKCCTFIRVRSQLNTSLVK